MPAVLEQPQEASKPVCQVGGLYKEEQACASGIAEGWPGWLQSPVVEAVQAGPQIVTEGAVSAGFDPIEPVWIVQRFVMAAQSQVARAGKRLILAGAALLFPLRQYFAGSV